MEIRQLTEQDEQQLLDLLEKLSAEGHDLSVIRMPKETGYQKDLQHAVYLGAFDDDAMVGVYRASIPEKAPHKCSLCIGLTAPYQGKDVALQFFEAGLPLLKERGVEVIHAWIYSFNMASIAFAEKVGFEEYGKVPVHHYRDGEAVDDLLYAYFLEKERS